MDAFIQFRTFIVLSHRLVFTSPLRLKTRGNAFRRKHHNVNNISEIVVRYVALDDRSRQSPKNFIKDDELKSQERLTTI